MGEYAMSGGSRIKIGTCEDMYYLRWDQAHKVTESETDLNDPAELAVIRFRFPWPDEDGNAPGDFDDYERGLRLNVPVPAEVDHGLVQFSARNGYLVSLPCPEAADQSTPYTIHRNGYGGPCSLVQQGWRGGRLVGIAHCNGCGAAYRLEDGHEEAAAVGIRAQADKQATTNDAANGGSRRLHEIADRLLAGYSLTMPGSVTA